MPIANNKKNRRLATLEKHEAIRRRFKLLHEQKRIRFDDAIDRLMKEFFITNEAYLIRILKQNNNDE
jgi:hypothetical protein